MKKYYTGIGSRETKVEFLSLMEEIAFKLSQDNWILRSGGADGADAAFERGASNTFASVKPNIYLPWDGFNGLKKDKNHPVATEFDNYEQAWEIASETHPAWDRMSAGGQALHSRNVYQVLGHDLSTPSKFLICYAKPTKTGVSGGTNTAWVLAKKYNIPCFNLYNEVDLKRVSKLLED